MTLYRLRNLNSPVHREPRPKRPRRGRGEAVCGSFPPCAEDLEVPPCPELAAWSDEVVPVEPAEVPAVPWSEEVVPVDPVDWLVPVWPDVEGVVADVLPWLGVVELGLLLWLEDCAVFPCEPELALEPEPVCAARHKLASSRGEASHSFFIKKVPPE